MSLVALLCATCSKTSAPSDVPSTVPTDGHRRYIYAVFDDGSVHVYDIDQAHREVASFVTTNGVLDVRGVCASAKTGVMYIGHQRPEAGYVVAVDVAHDGQVLWNRAYQPNVDRLSCSHDGKKVYVPSNEAFPADTLVVLDGATGDELSRVHVSPKPHDCLDGLSGAHVFLETKSSDVIAVIDTSSDKVVSHVGPFAGILGPYTVDAKDARVYVNVYGVNGFQVGDVATGKVIATASIAKQTVLKGTLDQHGIALSPDETEVWVNDGVGNAKVTHVFDVTVMPPVAKHDVALDYANPHWVTFSIAGDFAYVAGPKHGGMGTNVIDAKTYARAATIGASEDMLEIDFEDGAIVRVGNQFGVGRKP